MNHPDPIQTEHARARLVRRMSAKIFLRDGVTIDQSELIPIFHRWISADRFDQLLIDVADYRHVHHGPGVMLIAHEGHYAMDGGNGSLGLRFEHTRSSDTDPRRRLRDVLRTTLLACAQLQREADVRFETGEILLQFADRLMARDTDATFRTWRAMSADVLSDLYPGTTVRYERAAGGMAGVHVRADIAPELEEMITRLGMAT